MPYLDEKLHDSNAAIREHLAQLESFTGDPEDQFAVLAERRQYVADAFSRGDIDTTTALRLAMYTTHSVAEGQSYREQRMARMDQLLTDVRPGETALVDSVRSGFTGGVLDGQLGMEVSANESGPQFIVNVPLAHLPGEPRIARIPMGHMLIQAGFGLTKCNYVYTGEEQIADFTRMRGFESLRPVIHKDTAHMGVERDVNLCVGLYQAGMTLAECGIGEETRIALYEKFSETAGRTLGRSFPQAIHVVTMERLT